MIEELNEIAELKERLHQFGKIKARIENWEINTFNPDSGSKRQIIHQTIIGVLRIFAEEGQ